MKIVGGQYGCRAVRELRQYFTAYGPIEFTINQEEGRLVAVSSNFRHGSIVTHGSTSQELDQNIEDAILTAFDVPAVYKHQARPRRLNSGEPRYAVA
ncbi:MAG: hypothetical protein V1707_03745 [bacterium]